MMRLKPLLNKLNTESSNNNLCFNLFAIFFCSLEKNEAMIAKLQEQLKKEKG